MASAITSSVNIAALTGLIAPGTIAYPAGQDLPGLSAWVLWNGKLWIADKDSLESDHVCVGVNSYPMGALALAYRGGRATGFTNLQTQLPYFLGNNGAITAQVPTSGWFVKLGQAESANELYVAPQRPIFRV